MQAVSTSLHGHAVAEAGCKQQQQPVAAAQASPSGSRAVVLCGGCPCMFALLKLFQGTSRAALMQPFSLGPVSGGQACVVAAVRQVVQCTAVMDRCVCACCPLAVAGARQTCPGLLPRQPVLRQHRCHLHSVRQWLACSLCTCMAAVPC